jgi:hypothetical protein
MKRKTKEKMFDLLYRLEDLYQYNETKIGREIGKIIDQLQSELLNKKK